MLITVWLLEMLDSCGQSRNFLSSMKYTHAEIHVDKKPGKQSSSFLILREIAIKMQITDRAIWIKKKTNKEIYCLKS